MHRFEDQIAALQNYLLSFARLQLRDQTWVEVAASDRALAGLNRPYVFGSRTQLKTWFVGKLNG